MIPTVRAGLPLLPRVLAAALAVAAAPAVESPTSYGEAAQVDTPVLSIPRVAKPPVIDGTMQEGEWEDTSALTGFWYDYAQNDFRFLASAHTQVRVHLGFDAEKLYLAYDSPVYPESSWMKARGRFPDVLGHPLYGIQWDDHVEIELRPYADNAKGFEHGLFRFYVNPINTLTDYMWSVRGGEEMKWKSGAQVRTTAGAKRWQIEMAVPLTAFAHGAYAEKEADGRPRVVLPPPDGTAWRAWFTRGIGGNGAFFNCFDNHAWNTTKTRLVLDSQAPSVQVLDLGPIMEDNVDLRVQLKNHSPRSETVRFGFFVESPEGLVYSSYDAPELQEGMCELRPGEVKKLRLRRALPGIAKDGNVLWFDVRSAGQPAKVLYRTRLQRFHSMEGGSANGVSYTARRLDVIAKLRPPKEDFSLHWQFSPYRKRLFAAIDTGIEGASEEAKRAVEARISVLKADLDEDVIAEATVRFAGSHAAQLIDLKDAVAGERYKLSVLLFDADKRIVGERNPEPFRFQREPWMENTLGLDDVVWEPFTPIAADAGGFDTLKHRFTIAPSGLPAQIAIKPDPRDLPLELRLPGAKPDAASLAAVGRGDQLRAPLRLEAVIAGKRVPATVVEAAKPVREWKSERTYRARLAAGPLAIELTTTYDCDGAMRCQLAYQGDGATQVEALELVGDLAGSVDLIAKAIRGGSMAGSDTWECGLPQRPGVVWDSTQGEPPELFYSRFVPFVWFGSGDRGFTWFCDSDQGWGLDRDGASMALERDQAGATTWRVRFVNHAQAVGARRELAFTVLTHPAKPKPAQARTHAWHRQGQIFMGYQGEPYDVPEEALLKNWRAAANAPKDTPDEQRTTFRNDAPGWLRYGFWRNVQLNVPEMDQTFEDKAIWFFERKIRIGRRTGGWMDEYWPIYRSLDVAAGNARLRDPAEVKAGELPWQDGFLTGHMRNFYKRMARVHQQNNVPNRNATWANNATTMLESFTWDALLVEEAGAGHRSYDIDVVTQFPETLYRFLAKSWTGTVVRLVADENPAGAGDDKRYERQWLGRALLHDIGVNYSGPHGRFRHPEQGFRLLARLTAFGLFDEARIERIPHWRNRAVRWGAEGGRTHATVYRRAGDDGRAQRAIIVLMNESDGPAEHPLALADAAALAGAAPSATAATLRARAQVPAELADWWKRVAAAAPDGAQVALTDLETGEAIPAIPGQAGAFGPVHVPYHDFRVVLVEGSK